MKTHFIILSMLMLALVLVACDGAPLTPGASSGQSPAAATTPSADTPAAGAGGPRANRTPAPNFTPGAQQPGAQRTPSAASTSAPNSAPTSAVSANTNSTAPTAVPIPQIVIPTAVPSNAQTDATPTNASNTNATAPVLTPAPTISAPLPTPSAATSLDALHGQIVFFSDRGGAYPQLYVMNADGGNQRLCNCSDVLQTLVTNDVSSPDMQQALFVKQVGGRQADYQIWAHNTQTNEDKVVTGGAPGFPTVDYDAVWSPDSKHIAWVTEANGFDEIYVYDRTTNENVRLTESHGEWYKHPSFSPDGARIVFWSNHDDANTKQIWVMNLDGSNQHNLSQNPSNDWDPIWVK